MLCRLALGLHLGLFALVILLDIGATTAMTLLVALVFLLFHSLGLLLASLLAILERLRFDQLECAQAHELGVIEIRLERAKAVLIHAQQQLAVLEIRPLELRRPRGRGRPGWWPWRWRRRFSSHNGAQGGSF